MARPGSTNGLLPLEFAGNALPNARLADGDWLAAADCSHSCLLDFAVVAVDAHLHQKLSECYFGSSPGLPLPGRDVSCVTSWAIRDLIGSLRGCAVEAARVLATLRNQSHADTP